MQQQKEIRESEQHFRHLLQTVKEYAIFTLDPDGFITSWNEGAEAIHGYRVAEIIGQHFSCFYLPEEREQNIPQRALLEAQQSGHYAHEGWHLRKDGSRYWAEVEIRPLRHANGTLRGYSKVVRDMTRRRLAEEALQKQSAMLKMLQEVAAAANQTSQIESAAAIALRRICQYSGWPAGLAYAVREVNGGDLTLMPVHSLASGEPFQRLLEVTQATHFSQGIGLPGAVCATGQYVWLAELASDPRFEGPAAGLLAVIKTGVAFPVLVGNTVTHVLEFFATESAEPDHDLLEAIAHISAQLGRVVERQQAEQALRQSEARFRTIFHGAATGIELVDLDRRLLAFNPAVCRFFGYPEDELYATALERADHPVNVTRGDTNFERLRTGALGSYTLERPYRHKEGHWVWGRSSISLVRGVGGEPQYAICMIEDITERKQMETEMMELHRRLLEGREEERLHLAQELHDGPIQELYGQTYNLQAFHDHLPGDVDSEPLREMQHALQQVIGTLRSISGELRPPALAPFGLEKAIRSHAQEFHEAYPQLAIQLDLMPDRQLLPEKIRLALFRIYQVALFNVLWHAEASQAAVRFTYDATHACLEVRDDGKGFKVPRRWIELARTGHLGIVGAVERAEAIGGSLEVESEPGKGTCVRVNAPLGETRE